MKVLRCIVFFVFIYTVISHPASNKPEEEDYDKLISEHDPSIQNDDYEYGAPEDDDAEPDVPDPVLTTAPQDFIAKAKETVRLPCHVQNGDNLVLLWKKNNEIIFQDSIKFGHFGDNFHVENKTLVISNLGANDTANYTCSALLTKTSYLNVTHRLYVETAPEIASISALHDVLQLDAGSTLVLTCKAIGYPTPSVTWARRGITLGKHEVISIENISHDDAGDYQCLADNNINPPAHKHIHIDVVHKPIVKIEKLTVNSDKNLDTQLICIVHGVPDAVVNWQKDGTNIRSSKRKHIKHYNHTYILEINQVQNEDFGHYTCSAVNRVGKSEKQVTLTALPSPAEHISTEIDSNGNVKLLWNVESNSPIIEYLVEYKLEGSSHWHKQKPEVTNPDGIFYTVNHTLPNLGDGHYEVKLRSMNMYGTSDYSKVVHVRNGENHHTSHTPHHHHHHKSESHVDQPDKAEQVKQAGEQHPFVSQKPLAPVVVEVIPYAEQKEYSVEQKAQVSERQQQPTGKQGNPGGSSGILPTISLLCITLLLIIYSR